MTRPAQQARRMSRAQTAAYSLGRQAADAGRCGHSPYDGWREGFAWIAGWEERMGKLKSPTPVVLCRICEARNSGLGVVKDVPL